MILKELELKNFRLFSFMRTNISEGINIFTGMNGQGKTTILESIYYLTLSKSFRTSSDKNAIQYDKLFFDINSTFISEASEDKKIRVYFSTSEGKHIFVEKNKVARLTEYIGKFPSIILTMNDLKLSFAGPSERRRFLNILLSQISPLYLDNLKQFKRIVQQRNTLLATENRDRIEEQIEGWNSQLVNCGSAIIKKRLEFVDFLNQRMTKTYAQFSSENEKIAVNYKSSFGRELSFAEITQIEALFSKKLKLLYKYELDIKKTVVGPHRDDLEFYKNSKLFKEFGSQGENKTLIISLKILEWEYLKMEKQQTPLLLLDDIFSELDEYRMTGLLEFLNNVGQTFITTTEVSKFKSPLIARKFLVKDAKVYDA